MSRYDSKNFPRRFQVGSVYRSRRVDYMNSAIETEMMFVVLDVKTSVFWNEPAEYWALDLFTGEKFDFHRASRLAEDAVLVES